MLPQHRRATYVIVGLNLLVFALTAYVADAATIDVDTLIRFGANDRALGDQSWRLLTCTFLHADSLALLANMWWLAWTGPMVERRVGMRGFLILYLFGAVGASMTSTIWNGDAVSVGASGALWCVWGLMIALTIMDPRSRSDEKFKTMCGFVLIAIAADLLSVRANVDTAAHLGGLLTGFVCGATSLSLLAVRRVATSLSWRLATA